MDLPPGIVYFSTKVPYLLTPPTIVYIFNVWARQTYNIEFPLWLVCIAGILSLPLAFTLLVIWNDFKIERDAAARGAILPPTVDCKWIGGLDILRDGARNFKDRYPGDNLIPWFVKYGNTINSRILFENRIITIEPECIKAILTSNFSNYEKGEAFRFQMKSVLGTGVFNSDSEMWKFHRTMTRPFCSKDRISHFDIFDRHADDSIEQMKARFKDGYAVEFQDLISRFTLDSAAEFLFGHNVHSLSVGLAYPESVDSSKLKGNLNPPGPDNVFAKSFKDAQTAMAMRGRYGAAWPLFEFWSDKAKSKMGRVNDFIEPILQSAIQKKRMRDEMEKVTGKKEVVEEEGQTLLDHLVQYTEDQTILKDEILNMLVAGRDTTASTMTFIVYMLSQHPDVLKRLRKEILSKIASRRPTYEDMKDMKYLRAVINETLRLFPIVPMNVRSTINPTLWPSKRPDGKPYYIPAGTKSSATIIDTACRSIDNCICSLFK